MFLTQVCISEEQISHVQPGRYRVHAPCLTRCRWLMPMASAEHLALGVQLEAPGSSRAVLSVPLLCLLRQRSSFFRSGSSGVRAGVRPPPRLPRARSLLSLPPGEPSLGQAAVPAGLSCSFPSSNPF